MASSTPRPRSRMSSILPQTDGPSRRDGWLRRDPTEPRTTFERSSGRQPSRADRHRSTRDRRLGSRCECAQSSTLDLGDFQIVELGDFLEIRLHEPASLGERAANLLNRVVPESSRRARSREPRPR